MKNGSSHLVAGMAFGALLGACATYLIIKNKATLKREFEEVADKVKHGVHDMAHKAKEKAEEFGEKAKEKTEEFGYKAKQEANKTAGEYDFKSQNLNDKTSGKTY